jgi:hypothetical protein
LIYTAAFSDNIGTVAADWKAKLCRKVTGTGKVTDWAVGGLGEGYGVEDKVGEEVE